MVVDETGDVKKSTHTVGTQRQYTGTAGRIENAPVAVYLTYAGPRSHALIDRALYLPKSWTDERGPLRSSWRARTRWKFVKGQWELPGGGRDTCPVAVMKPAR